jgi:hypothetical protein
VAEVGPVDLGDAEARDVGGRDARHDAALAEVGDHLQAGEALHGLESRRGPLDLALGEVLGERIGERDGLGDRDPGDPAREV